MCGSPEVDTSYQDWSIKEAERTRAEETARQARISEGLKQIKAVFEGGMAGGAVTPLAVTTIPGSKVATPSGGGTSAPASFADHGPPGGRAQPAAAMTMTPETYQAGGQIFTDRGLAEKFAQENGTRAAGTAYNGMAPILDQRELAMKDYYLPQLDKKRDDALEQLTFALSRAGLLTSSVAGEKQADLGEDYSLQKGSVLSKIAADRAGTETAMNQQRSQIEAALRASGDVSAATNQALSTTSTFKADQPEMDPLGDLFYGIASGIGAAKQGQQVAAVRKSMTPSPLRAGSGRNVA